MLIESQAASKAGASSAEWASAVSAVVGGKAGGKASTSIGNGTNVDKIDDAVAAATEYLKNLQI
jgi:alanyl-tRNA synthetase